MIDHKASEPHMICCCMKLHSNSSAETTCNWHRTFKKWKKKNPASAPTLVLCLLFCPAIAVHGISLYILSLLGLLKASQIIAFHFLLQFTLCFLCLHGSTETDNVFYFIFTVNWNINNKTEQSFRSNIILEFEPHCALCCLSFFCPLLFSLSRHSN